MTQTTDSECEHERPVPPLERVHQHHEAERDHSEDRQQGMFASWRQAAAAAPSNLDRGRC